MTRMLVHHRVEAMGEARVLEPPEIRFTAHA